MTTRREISLLLAATGLGAGCGVEAGAQEKSASHRLVKSGDTVWEVLLDGLWEAGENRHYDRELIVPGLASDPAKPTNGALWYRRTITLPVGAWSQATLTLMGARFAPEVYVDGRRVSASDGGMAATHHGFVLPAAGGPITLEIALRYLSDLDPRDASAVPGADRWRSNVSSYLWDSVVLRLRGAGEIMRVAPGGDLASDSLSVRWGLAAPPPAGAAIRFSVLDDAGETLIDSGARPIASAQGVTDLKLLGRVRPWSPEAPNLYRLRAELIINDAVSDVREQSLGQREFKVAGLGSSCPPLTCVMGLSGEALLSIWRTRGADPSQIRQGEYFAYELAGYYAFAKHKDDRAVADQLRERVRFLVADAPALAGVVNPLAPIEVVDLHGLYREGQNGGQVQTLAPLANADKNLTRSPVVKLTFGSGAGALVISQLLMAGRLRQGQAEAGPGVYGLRYDPAAVQLALNMIDAAL